MYWGVTKVHPFPINFYQSHSEDTVVFSSVRLYVCLFINTITPELLEISSQNYQGIILWSKGQTCFKMAG